MPAPSLPELQLRVRAWHNRHPLAQRIALSQVVSIGEVLLPFASAEHPAGDEAAGDPARVSDFGEGQSAVTCPVLGPTPTPQSPETDATEGEAAFELPPLGAPLRPPELTPEAAPQPSPGLTEVTDGTVRTDTAPDAAAVAPPQAAAAAATPSFWRAWLHGLRARAQMLRLRPQQPQAVFSRSIVWPLSAARIARWVQRHGELRPLLPADWPCRLLETDLARQALAEREGRPHLMHLHVLSAAIQVGDRRMRVLMDSQGAVLGPRAYSQPRLAGAGALMLAGVLGSGLGLGLWWPDGEAPAAVPALALATAATMAPLQPAAAAPSAPASPAAPAVVASAAEPIATSAAAAPPTNVAVNAPTSPADAASATPLVQHQPMVSIRPALSAQDKRAARELSGRMRDSQHVAQQATQQAAQQVALQATQQATQQATHQAAKQAAKQANRQANKPATPPATEQARPPVYAVVTAPSRQRTAAQRSLQLMRELSAKLPQPAPMQGELMRQQDAWRAAWWPFGSLADAERARVMLAGRGLVAEVVPF